MLAFVLTGCSESRDAPPVPLSTDSPGPVRTVAATEQQVRSFCGDCHAVPRPESFPRAAWYQEVRRGFDFYFQSGRTDLAVPTVNAVTAWYQERAPETLAVPRPSDSVHPAVRFEREPIVWPDEPGHRPPATSFVEFSELSGRGDSQQSLIVSDMRRGTVTLTTPSGDIQQTLTDVPHPAAARFADLDGNQVDDLIVADLGSFLPEDHDRGRVVWFPDVAAAGPVQSVELLRDVGRVADVACGDLDGDGDLDVVAAEFGWHATGGIHVLWREDDASGRPVFTPSRIDRRPGTVHVRIQDLDGDGRPDLLALITQEHEVLVAFFNRGDGFESRTLFAAPDPSWGFSGMEPCDFDGDGDLDVLLTNGDTFDSYLIKPYHSIRLLRNLGALQFREEFIGAMPGVHRALPVDLDGDGDQDIVACSLLPERCLQGADPEALQAIVWFENRNDQPFERHLIRSGLPTYSSLAIADPNHDGRPDVLVGGFHETGPQRASLEIYRNLMR